MNEPLTAEGRDFLGLGVSVAASPTNSVPAKEKAAVTKTYRQETEGRVRSNPKLDENNEVRILTAQIPLKPFDKAPGSRQY